ncbi:hypothetical protein ACQ4LE_003207 [Meloidogyne hapla]
MNNPYRLNFGNDGNTNNNKLTTQQQFSNQIASQFQQQQSSQLYLQGSSNFLLSNTTSSNNNGNTIPNSPHSDTAALPLPPSSLGGMAKRPLSVPPQNVGIGRIGGGKQQQLHNRQQQTSTMSAREFFSRQIRRPQQIQQPIAEEIEIVGQNKNVIINEDDGKEYFLNEEEGNSGGKRRHSSFSITPNNQSKMQRNQTNNPAAEVVTLEEEDELETEDSGNEITTEPNSHLMRTTDTTELSSIDQLSSQFHSQKKITSTSLASNTSMLMNPASAGGLLFPNSFTDHSSTGHSPIKSIDHKRTDLGEEHQVKSQLQQEELELRRQQRRAPILLDSRALERAMSQRLDNPSEQHPIPPLEQFLQGQYLLSRLLPFFELAVAEMQRRGERGKLNLPVKEFHWSPQQGILTVTFPSYPIINVNSNIDTAPQQSQTSVHFIKMQLLVCPKDFRLITKLEYSGFNCPIESDIRIFERFFASYVTKIDNEMAVFSFIILCRLSSQQIFSSLAQIMAVQMEPGDYPWRIEFELLHTADEQQQNFSNNQQRPNVGQILKKVQQSVMVTDMYKQFLFITYLYPNTSTNGTINHRYRIYLRYLIESNDLNLPLFGKQQHDDFDLRIINAMNSAKTELLNKQIEEQSSSVQQREQCCIWPCIRALLEGKHTNRMNY